MDYEKCCGVEEFLIIDQNIKKINSTKINKLLETLKFKKRTEKSIMKSLICSLCNQVVVNPPMVSHVLFKDESVKVS